MRQKLATWLYKLVSGRELPGLTARKMEVVVIYPEASSLSECLGITDKRTDQLIGAIKESVEKDDTIGGAMVLLSKECKHPNELAACCFVLGSHTARLQNPFLHLFSR